MVQRRQPRVYAKGQDSGGTKNTTKWWLENKKENYDIDEKLIDQFYNEGKLYIKNLEKEDLSPDYSGIRPKIYIDNNPMPDFYIEHEESKGLPGWINLIGIESPGITASIAIGEKISKIVN